MRRIGIAIGIVGLLWVFLRPPAEPPAEPPAPRRAAPMPAPEEPSSEDPLRIEVISVLATNRFEGIDPELRDVARQLRFTPFSGFQFLEEQSDDLLPGETLDLPILGGRGVEILLVALEPDAARLRMKLWTFERHKVLDMTVSVHLGRCFMVAGPKLDDGVLLLPICAGRLP